MSQPSPSAGILQVFIFRNGEFMGTELFPEKQVVVGRDNGIADLVLDSHEVSRRHAVIEHDGVHIRVRDVGSTNGIFVNNERVESAEVTRLDELTLGDFSLKFKIVRRGGAERSVDPDATRSVVGPEPAEPEEPKAAKPKPHKTPVAEAPEPSRRARSPAPVSEAHFKPQAESPPQEVRPKAARAPQAAADEVVSQPAQAFRHGLPPGTDLSEWDDREEGRHEPKLVRDAPAAEFRDANEVLDKNRFASMLQRIGIAPHKKAVRIEKAQPAEFEGTPTRLDPLASKADEKAEKPKEEGSSEAARKALFQVPTVLLGEGVHPHDDEDDDDDDEDEEYIPDQLLATKLCEEASREKLSGDLVMSIEVLVEQHGALLDGVLLGRGESYYVGPAIGWLRRLRDRSLPQRVRMLDYRRAGECRVELRKGASGFVKRRGQRLPFTEAPGTQRTRRGSLLGRLLAGDLLEVTDGPKNYNVRFMNPPPPVKDERTWKQRLRPDNLTLGSFGTSAGAHFAVLIILGFLGSGVTQAAMEPQEEFVEVSLANTPELEEPKAEPVQEKQAPAQEVPKNMEAAPLKKGQRPRTGGTSNAPAGVLGLLSKRGSSAAPGPAAAVAAVSNLSAAKVPGGSSGYRVSSLIGKLPTSSLSVGGGGGGLITKGGASLLRGGGGGAGALGGKGTRAVGGLVQKDPRAMRQVGQGQLDRDEIQKVINENIGQIQRCYERELLKNAGLSGKVQVEWTVSTGGSVRTARQTFSSMQSSEVSNCIMGAIRGWRFPKPRGGEVIVSYPFIFKPIGF